MTPNEMPAYSASCPLCGYEHDYPNKWAMTKAWNQWVKPFETAMNGLSIALTSEDKNILRRSIGIPSHG